MIATAKRDGVRITVETCPHYLTLLAEEIPNGATAFKCCPPIREASNRELLWQGLEDGSRALTPFAAVSRIDLHARADGHEAQEPAQTRVTIVRCRTHLL